MKSLSDPFDTSVIKEHAIRFLRKRGFNSEDIERYNLGYCSEGYITIELLYRVMIQTES